MNEAGVGYGRVVSFRVCVVFGFRGSANFVDLVFYLFGFGGVYFFLGFGDFGARVLGNFGFVLLVSAGFALCSLSFGDFGFCFFGSGY